MSGHRRTQKRNNRIRAMTMHETDHTFSPSSWFARGHLVPARATARSTDGKDTVTTAKPDAFDMKMFGRSAGRKTCVSLVRRYDAAAWRRLRSKEPGANGQSILVSASRIAAPAVRQPLRYRRVGDSDRKTPGAHDRRAAVRESIIFCVCSCTVDRFEALPDPATVTKLCRICR